MVSPKNGQLGSINSLDEGGLGTVDFNNANAIDLKAAIHSATASTPATGLGLGAFWVSTGTPTLPKFTNSVGATITLGSGSGFQSLAETLINGNTTDGYDIVISGNSIIYTDDGIGSDNGSNFLITLGDGGLSGGDAGAFILTGGTPGANKPGSSFTVNLSQGNGSGNGGSFNLNTGVGGGTGSGGDFNINTGSASGTAGAGGSVDITLGNGIVTGDGGSFNITTGNGGVTGDGGDIIFTAGNGGATSGDAGNIILTSGSLTSGDIGYVIIDGLKYPKTDGSNGQVLVTNGTGILSFQSSTSGVTDVEVTADGLPNTDTITVNENLGTVTIDLPNMVISDDSLQLGFGNRDVLISDGYNIFVGSNITPQESGGSSAHPISSNVIVGANVQGSDINSSVILGINADAVSAYRSVQIGNESATLMSGSVNNTVLIGYSALISASDAINGSVMIGYHVGDSGGDLSSSVGIGQFAMRNAGDVTQSVAIGYGAMDNAIGVSTDNVAIGFSAGSDVETFRSVMIGALASCESTDSIAIGYDATTTAIDSIAIGHQVESRNASGIVIGYQAGLNDGYDSSGSLFMGYKSRANAEAVSTNSTIIGYESGYQTRMTTTRSTIIGYQALSRSSSTVVGSITNSLLIGTFVGRNLSGTLSNSTLFSKGDGSSATLNGTNRHWFGQESDCPADNFVSFYGLFQGDLTNGKIGLGVFTSDDLTSYDSKIQVFTNEDQDDGIIRVQSSSTGSYQRPVLTLITAGTGGAEAKVFVGNDGSTTGTIPDGSLYVKADALSDSSLYQHNGTNWIRKDTTISDGVPFTGTRSFALSDMGKTVHLTGVSTGTATIDGAVVFPIGTIIYVSNISSGGLLTINTSGGATVNSLSGSLTIAQYGIAKLWQRDTNIWILSGDV